MLLLCGAPWTAGLKAFFTTPQLSLGDKVSNSLALGTSPVVRALFDPEGAMCDIRALDSVSFTEWFMSHGGSRGSIERMWDPIGAALLALRVPRAGLHGLAQRAWRAWVHRPRSAAPAGPGWAAGLLLSPEEPVLAGDFKASVLFCARLGVWI
jgi:hypothetical protein